MRIHSLLTACVAMSMANCVAAQKRDSEKPNSSIPVSAQNSGEPDRGLWFGNIRVCRDTVTDVSVASDEIGTPTLVVQFTRESQELIFRQTEQRVGQSMPIRLDGRTILNPVVYEPISDAKLQLTPVEEVDARQIERAALSPC
jgi:preprotein translocase subunit SecD